MLPQVTPRYHQGLVTTSQYERQDSEDERPHREPLLPHGLGTWVLGWELELGEEKVMR